MTSADSYLENPTGEYVDDEPTESEPISFLATEDINTAGEDSNAFLKTPPRPRGAVIYEKKVKRILISVMRYTIRDQRTLPDAAAIIRYGQDVSVTGGNFAATNEYAAKAVDFLSEGAGNPMLEFIAAAGMMTLQILRNHEQDVVEVETEAKHRIKIPFTQKWIPLRVRIKLGRLRHVTQEPRVFTAQVLSDPRTQEMLAKYHDISITASPNGKVDD